MTVYVLNSNKLIKEGGALFDRISKSGDDGTIYRANKPIHFAQAHASCG
jgi:hypothetical protein